MNTKYLLILAGALVILTAGVGLYLSKNQPQQQPTAETQSTSDEVSSIEKDLKDTNVENIDQEMVQIESELNASY